LREASIPKWSFSNDLMTHTICQRCQKDTKEKHKRSWKLGCGISSVNSLPHSQGWDLGGTCLVGESAIWDLRICDVLN
jgi:hypothetical protein